MGLTNGSLMMLWWLLWRRDERIAGKQFIVVEVHGFILVVVDLKEVAVAHWQYGVVVDGMGALMVHAHAILLGAHVQAATAHHNWCPTARWLCCMMTLHLLLAELLLLMLLLLLQPNAIRVSGLFV